MALPPTKIYVYLKETPAETIESLKNAGFLKRSALRNERALRDITQAIKKYHSRRTDMPGPNEDDIVVDSLRKYLSFFGRWVAAASEHKPSTLFLLCFPFIKLYGKIKRLFY